MLYALIFCIQTHKSYFVTLIRDVSKKWTALNYPKSNPQIYRGEEQVFGFVPLAYTLYEAVNGTGGGGGYQI